MLAGPMHYHATPKAAEGLQLSSVQPAQFWVTCGTPVMGPAFWSEQSETHVHIIMVACSHSADHGHATDEHCSSNGRKAVLEGARWVCSDWLATAALAVVQTLNTSSSRQLLLVLQHILTFGRVDPWQSAA